jgi:hypothetical protein
MNLILIKKNKERDWFRHNLPTTILSQFTLNIHGKQDIPRFLLEDPRGEEEYSIQLNIVL